MSKMIYHMDFKDANGKKMMEANQQDLALFLLSYDKEIEIISITPKRYRRPLFIKISEMGLDVVGRTF